jgi:hypothetical protein
MKRLMIDSVDDDDDDDDDDEYDEEIDCVEEVASVSSEFSDESAQTLQLLFIYLFISCLILVVRISTILRIMFTLPTVAAASRTIPPYASYKLVAVNLTKENTLFFVSYEVIYYNKYIDNN